MVQESKEDGAQIIGKYWRKNKTTEKFNQEV